MTAVIDLKGRLGLSGYRPPRNMTVEVVSRRLVDDDETLVYGALRPSSFEWRRVASDFGEATFECPVPIAEQIGRVEMRAQKHNVRIVRDGKIEFAGPIRSVEVGGGSMTVRAVGWTSWTLTKLLQADARVAPVEPPEGEPAPEYVSYETFGALGETTFDYGPSSPNPAVYVEDLVSLIMTEARALDQSFARPPEAFQLTGTTEFPATNATEILDEQLLSVREHMDQLLPDLDWAEVGTELLSGDDLLFYDVDAGEPADNPAWTVTDHDFTDRLSRGVIGPIVNEKARMIESSTNGYVLIETWLGLNQLDPSIQGGAETGIHQASYTATEPGLSLTDIYGRRILGRVQLSSDSRIGLPDLIPGARLMYRTLDGLYEMTIVGAPPRISFEVMIADVTVEVSYDGSAPAEAVFVTLVEP